MGCGCGWVNACSRRTEGVDGATTLMGGPGGPTTASGAIIVGTAGIIAGAGGGATWTTVV